MTAKNRRLFYGVSSIITGIVTILVATNVVGDGAESSVNGLLAGLVALFGTGATATAAVHTNRQIKEGTLDPVSKDVPPRTYNPADAVIGGLNDLNNMHAQVQEGLGRIQEAAATVGIPLPTYGQQSFTPPATTDLVQQAIDASRRAQ